MKKSFSIDARAILTLGRDSIKDHTTALLELVKNSYDADAKMVEVEIFCHTPTKYIRIVDNGCGMNEKQVENNWLRIGYSEKRSSKFSDLKRRKTGEKGIGRISADRLGALLELKTKAKSEKPFGLKVNWDDFNIDGKDLNEVEIEVLETPQLKIPNSPNEKSDKGTELIITELRQNWSKEDIENLYTELSILTPPFQKVKDFEIFIKTDVIDGYSRSVESLFLETAEIELQAAFDTKHVYYSIKDRFSKNKDSVLKEKMSWKNLIQRTVGTEREGVAETPKLGPVKLTFLFYPRESRILEGTKFRLSDLREFLDKNAGVKIYRDNIRVKPYGDPNEPEGDWLGLAERKTREPAGVSRPTYKIAANQLVGAVFVSRDNNPELVDSSSREGLIQGDALTELRQLAMGCLLLLESHRHIRFTEEENVREQKASPSEEVKLLNDALVLLKKDLKSVKEHVPRTTIRPIERTLDQIVEVSEKIKDAQPAIDELVSQARITRGLATIGIAAAVFAHETQSAISAFLSATNVTKSILEQKQASVTLAIAELNKAKKYAKQVAAWGAFALARIQQEKRMQAKPNIKNIVEKVATEIEPIFKAANIDVSLVLNSLEAQTFVMDIEAILLNLLTNAYTACQQTERERKIRIELHEVKNGNIEGFEIIVADSGPGVAERFKDQIWDPLFSTKVDRQGRMLGTGLGLSIVQSIVDDLKGKKKVDSDSKLKGARFTIWLPFKLR